MLNTRINELYNNNDVINSNDLRKRILNIDSRFRSSCAALSTDFQYSLEHPYKNIIRIKVASIEIPNMFYTFSTKKGNTSFIVKAYDILNFIHEETITIPDGNYTSTEIVTEIQAEFDEKFKVPYGIFFSVAINTNTAKITIANQGVSSFPVTSPSTIPSVSAKPFSLNFLTDICNKERTHNFGLGYHLGFRNKLYKAETSEPSIITGLTAYSITGEGCLDVVGDTYMFLSVNDLHTVEQKTNNNYFQVLAKIIVREEKQTVIYDDGATLLSNEIIFPSPIDLKILQIKLLDPYGEVIDLCGMNFSFSLEITEVLNTKLYDFYRNYIWLGSVPSVNYKNVQGAAVPLIKGRGPPF
jgi:hypothetical protein